MIWSGKPNKYAAKVTLTDGGKKLVAGTDYKKTIEYSVNGTVLDKYSPGLDEWTVVTVKVEATGNNYTGVKTGTYSIIPKAADISKASFKIADQEFIGEGTEITLDENDFVTSIINKYTKLEYGTDFEVTGYSNNINKGTAKVTLHGIGNYGGTKTVTFKIVSRDANTWWQRILG